MPVKLMLKIILRSLISLVLSSFVTGCQRELAFEVINPQSEGTLQKDNSGNCQTFAVNGNFTRNIDVAATDLLEVKVMVTRGGSYLIHSNQVNGLSFSASGTFDSAATYVVKLAGKGRPVTAGNTTFTITYGSSTCQATIVVADTPASKAEFTLVGAPVECMNPLVSGDIVVGQNLDTSYRVSLTVMVTVPGIYFVTTNQINGYHFEGSDTVNSIGEQKTSLHAVGKPLIAGIDVFKVTIGASSCSFTSRPLAPVKAFGRDYFPLSDGSYWTYDYSPGYPNDSLTRRVTGSVKLENNDYVIVKEKHPYKNEADLYFRKTGSGFREYASPSKYTETISYVPGTTGEIPILEESSSDWASPAYEATASFGQVTKLRYRYAVLEADGVAVINGTAFEHVIKVQMTVGVSAVNYTEGSTGETHLFYFAKGIGLIYTRLAIKERVLYEQKLRRWLVN
jgi:hypothetical protein